MNHRDFRKLLHENHPDFCELSPPELEKLEGVEFPQGRNEPINDANFVKMTLKEIPPTANKLSNAERGDLVCWRKYRPVELAAFYRSFHYSTPEWGIFYFADAISRIAMDIMDYYQSRNPSVASY